MSIGVQARQRHSDERSLQDGSMSPMKVLWNLLQAAVCVFCLGEAGSAEPAAVSLEKPSIARPEHDACSGDVRYKAMWEAYEARVRETSQTIEAEIKNLGEAAKREGDLDGALLSDTALKEFHDSGTLTTLGKRGNIVPDSLLAAFKGYESHIQTLLSDYKALIHTLTQEGHLDSAFQLRVDSDDLAYVALTRDTLAALLSGKANAGPLHTQVRWVFSSRPAKEDWYSKNDNTAGKTKLGRWIKALVNDEGEEIGSYVIRDTPDGLVIKLAFSGGTSVITDIYAHPFLGEVILVGQIESELVGDRIRGNWKGRIELRKPMKVTRATVALALEECVGVEAQQMNVKCPHTAFKEKDLETAYLQMWVDYTDAIQQARDKLSEELVTLSSASQKRGDLDLSLFWHSKKLRSVATGGFSWRTSKTAWRQWFGETEYPESLNAEVAKCSARYEAARATIRKGYKSIEESLTKSGNLEQALAIRSEATGLGVRIAATVINRHMELDVWDPVVPLPHHHAYYKLSSGWPRTDEMKSIAKHGMHGWWRAVEAKGGQEVGCYAEHNGMVVVVIPGMGVICLAPLGYEADSLVMDGHLIQPDKKVAVAQAMMSLPDASPNTPQANK